MSRVITVTDEEYEIISSALTYRAGTLLVEAMRDPKVMAQMEAINDLGFRLCQDVEFESSNTTQPTSESPCPLCGDTGWTDGTPVGFRDPTGHTFFPCDCQSPTP